MLTLAVSLDDFMSTELASLKLVLRVSLFALGVMLILAVALGLYPQCF